MTWQAESGYRTARKAHRCDFCGLTIEAGERYCHWTIIDDTWFHGKGHLECERAWWWEGCDDEMMAHPEVMRTEILPAYRDRKCDHRSWCQRTECQNADLTARPSAV